MISESLCDQPGCNGTQFLRPFGDFSQRRRSWPPSNIAESASGIFVEPDSANFGQKTWKPLVQQASEYEKQNDEDPPSINNCDSSVHGEDSGMGHSMERANLAEKMVSVDKVAPTVSGANSARKRRIASIFQHYYPEGHWGYAVLTCSLIVQMFGHGLHMSVGTLGLAIQSRYFIQNFTNIGKTSFANFMIHQTPCRVIMCFCFVLGRP